MIKKQLQALVEAMGPDGRLSVFDDDSGLSYNNVEGVVTQDGDVVLAISLKINGDEEQRLSIN